jgi:hypothetical protein
MRRVTYYDISSGRILGAAVCTDEEVDLNIPVGGSYIDGIYDGLEFYMVGDVPTLLPPKPNEYCVFNYTTKQWVDTRTTEIQWDIVRGDRNQRLQVTDWTQLSDISAETKALWEPYRQALRDVTSQPDPFNIVWPTPP